MYFKQHYLGCLAHASYTIGSSGLAVVVDPRRDVDVYIDDAKAAGLAITHVLETHLHADFVSGHRELAERTGAMIVFGARAGVQFPHRAVKDGDEIHIGELVLRILETPGHTPESICILVTDAESHAEPKLVLTGDTLFIGDVGRPDLVGAAGHTAEEMAGMLYDSLHSKLLRLPDSVQVYPAHGAGSLCGRNISKETSSTVGEQRRFNYALQPMSKEAFVRMTTCDLPEVPRHFSRDVELNRSGAPGLAELPLPRALSPGEVADGAVLLLDTREDSAFATAHVPGSFHVGLQGQFASWAGTLLAPDKPLVLLDDDLERVREAVVRLSRVGLEAVRGYLKGGIAAWEQSGRPLARLPQIPVDELKARIDEGRAPLVVDVRRKGEYQGGHVPGAVHLPLDRLAEEHPGLDRERGMAIICAGGYRSTIASSLLARAGFRHLENVVGGTSAWTAAGFPVET